MFTSDGQPPARQASSATVGAIGLSILRQPNAERTRWSNGIPLWGPPDSSLLQCESDADVCVSRPGRLHAADVELLVALRGFHHVELPAFCHQVRQFGAGGAHQPVVLL